jgi:hypothetical protein
MIAERTGQRTGLGYVEYAPEAYRTKDGCLVVNPRRSYIKAAALSWLPIVIAEMDTRRRVWINAEIQFPDIIGESQVVETTHDDEILWAVRRGRNCHSRMVFTNKFAITLLRMQEVVAGDEKQPCAYMIVSAWIGPRTEMDPADFDTLYAHENSRQTRRKLRRLSRAFWANHAFVYEQTDHWEDSVVTRMPQNWGEAPQPTWQGRRRVGKRYQG